MYNSLISFVNKHNILSEAQNAFREITSTGTPTQAFIKTTQEATDQCIHVVGTFCCMVGRRRHVVDIQTEQDGGIYSTLGYASSHATSGCGCSEGRFERLTIHVGRYGFDKVRGKIKNC
jgi:hypothetical protein